MPEVINGLVSTIIPVYNRPVMILKAVDSVLAQTYRPIEIILVDDGSTDDTTAVLDQLAERHPNETRVIHKANGGPGLAREAGRQIARGEFIQYLDSDDWLLPNKFADQVAALRAHPESGIAYGITRLVDDSGKVLQEPSKWTGKKFDYLFPGLLVDRWWHTHTPLYRRAVSDAAGAWPKQRPEDWDLEARMGAAKTKLVHCGSVVSCHRDHPSTNRVTRGSMDAYLHDEAWFLPRLYECALKAGVSPGAPEMKHFSRWAFMRARYLGAMGESESAWRLLKLAEVSGGDKDLGMRVTSMMASTLGWKAAGRLLTFPDRWRG
jgi:glycosyltransferase involved in cell wall biosynthesis